MGYKNSKLTEDDIIDMLTGNKNETKIFKQMIGIKKTSFHNFINRL